MKPRELTVWFYCPDRRLIMRPETSRLSSSIADLIQGSKELKELEDGRRNAWLHLEFNNDQSNPAYLPIGAHETTVRRAYDLCSSVGGCPLISGRGLMHITLQLKGYAPNYNYFNDAVIRGEQKPTDLFAKTKVLGVKAP